MKFSRERDKWQKREQKRAQQQQRICEKDFQEMIADRDRALQLMKKGMDSIFGLGLRCIELKPERQFTIDQFLGLDGAAMHSLFHDGEPIQLVDRHPIIVGTPSGIGLSAMDIGMPFPTHAYDLWTDFAEHKMRQEVLSDLHETDLPKKHWDQVVDLIVKKLKAAIPKSTHTNNQDQSTDGLYACRVTDYPESWQLSVHWTKKGAYKAGRKWLIDKFDESFKSRQLIGKSRFDFMPGMHSFAVVPIEVQD